jgi:hypothetical protein
MPQQAVPATLSACQACCQLGLLPLVALLQWLLALLPYAQLLHAAAASAKAHVPPPVLLHPA